MFGDWYDGQVNLVYSGHRQHTCRVSLAKGQLRVLCTTVPVDGILARGGIASSNFLGIQIF